ncbi:MAG: hypothetical protein A2487_11240 [Candidatus Raymondbacteria bacterium RifOxyC12_full_50_8]|nr:MAG: hypothetical protein A2487_11240 [Candidatus Raymondbacteria bacterium RifOxyC12_full_50_8]
MLIGWGRVKLVRNEPNEALSLFEKAQKKLKKGKNPLGLANVAYYTARALKAQGEAKDALKQADEGERLYRIKNHVQGIKKCLVLKEALYRSLSDTQQADDIKRRINNLR